MVRTFTRTHVLTIGDNLSEEKNLQELSRQMKEIQNRNESHFLQAGIELEETNDFKDIDFMKKQWEDFVLQIVEQEDREKIKKIISNLGELKEIGESSSEESSRFKIR